MLGHDLGQREGELPQALVGDRADLEDRPAAGRQVGPDDVGQVARLGHVDLVEHHHPGPVVQAAVGGQLGLDGVDVGQRVALGLQRRAVDDVGQHRTPLDVAQELQAQPLAGGRARGSARAHRRSTNESAPACTTPRLGTSVVNG